MTRISQKVTFTGYVQGVGFRYCAREVAKGYEVTGTIKNLPTGNVEMIVAGEPDEIDGFIQAIQISEVARHIQSTQIENTPEKPEDHTDFRIVT